MRGRNPLHGCKGPDILGSYPALRRAAKRALELGLKTGTAVYAVKGGKIVHVTRGHRRERK